MNAEKVEKRPWTLDEDQAFVELLEYYVLKEGLSLNKSLEYISESLGRSFWSCQFRWIRAIKIHLAEDGTLMRRISSNKSV